MRIWLVGTMLIVALLSLDHLRALAAVIGTDIEPRIGLDYRSYVAAGELVRTGQANLLYQWNSPPFSDMSYVPFVYPPWFALVMVPFSLMSWTTGLLLWTLLGLLAMWAGLRHAGVRSHAYAGLALISFPAVLALGLGQSSFYLAGLSGFILGAIRHQHKVQAGVAVGLAGFKPHLLLGYPLLLSRLERSDRGTLLSATIATLMLLVISIAIVPGSVCDWVRFLITSADGLSSAILEVSLPQFFAFLLGTTASLAATIVSAIVLIPTVVIALRVPKRRLEARFLLALTTGLVLVPHAIVYDLLILVPGLAVLYQSEYSVDAVAAGSVLALLSSVGFMATEWQVEHWGRAIHLPTLALLALLALSLAWVLRDGPVLGHLASSTSPAGPTAPPPPA